MGKLYPVEQVAAAVIALAQAGIPPDVQELLVHGNPHLGVAPGALAKALTRIEAAPAVDRETLSIAIDAAISDGMKENGCVSVGQIADAIMALHPVKQSDGLAERVREACAARAEEYPSSEHADIPIIRGIASAIRSLDITRMDSDG